MTQKGHKVITGRHDLLLDSKCHVDFCGHFDLVYDPKSHLAIRSRRDLIYDPKGHGDFCDRFVLVYDPKVNLTFYLELDLKVKHLTWYVTTNVQTTL